MGNYHNKYEEYNPKKMAMVKKYEPIKSDKKKDDKFSKYAANLIIFNHNHSRRSDRLDNDHLKVEDLSRLASEIKDSTMMNSQSTTYQQKTESLMRTFLKINEENRIDTPQIDESENSEKPVQVRI